MSVALWFDEDGQIQEQYNARPQVGVVMRVGTMYARSYSGQDWWQTTEIIEILEENDHYVRFRTSNSIYEWSTPE